MNAVAETAPPYADSFAALQHTRAPDWLAELRRSAFARFTERGFPPERAEDWKYSNTRALQKLRFSPATTPPTNLGTEAIAAALLQHPQVQRLVFVDGVHVPALGSKHAAVPGLRITPLDTALREHRADLRELLLPEARWDNDPFTALNTAFLADGALIEAAGNVQVTAPVQLVFVSTPHTEACASHPRVMVTLGTNVKLTLVESYFGLDGAANFTNSCTQIALAANSRLDYFAVQREAQGDFHVSRVYVSQRERSRFASHVYNLGGEWVRNDLRVRLEDAGASVRMDGVYLADRSRHVDNHTRIDHLVAYTASDELYRGIIRDRGHAVFNGKVVVAEAAIKTDATQTNNNLLLTRNGEIDTKPELEIYADDVKCNHGATIGQLDEQALFYLRSRGLDLDTARELLTGAFARVVTDRIAAEPLRRFALEQLASALPQVAAEDGA
ncbi:MAG: Fe-S cluster assembly protein SufD [Gammaproteobacteria bacterium]|nr:Fe-S cluster assembly protein SufD [Gammaproteobacteria bacterium]MBU6510607.1 Fe-S cluster assembly protein SufD [Gammaproteobacteria bacterium]MDE1984768.1 Fe-S cluster assembly protein SufD [Gammaproteobacteria bacterium]MDE2109407.1 Fe-S cluster assembly protein SufD [Gammaproteobacteria bacterium]MDE2460953.1 Fe-S cluster assembly protein SufD [Gammaproteobacteria bacterium]